jgi:hypothetical protein
LYLNARAKAAASFAAPFALAATLDAGGAIAIIMLTIFV